MSKLGQLLRLHNPRVRTLFFVVCVAAVLIGGAAYRHHKHFKHLAVHQHGLIYRSAWMKPAAMKETIEKHQIRSVVNLCRPDELTPSDWDAERAVVTQSGARLIELPLPVVTKLDDVSIQRVIKILGDINNYPLLVHCQHGVTRTAKFLVIYDVAIRKMSATESLDAMPLFGRDEHNIHVRAFAREFERRYRELYPDIRAPDFQPAESAPNCGKQAIYTQAQR